MDSPQVLQHLSPSPLSLPPGPPVCQRGKGIEPGGDHLLFQGLRNAPATYQDTRNAPGNPIKDNDVITQQNKGSRTGSSGGVQLFKQGQRWEQLI